MELYTTFQRAPIMKSVWVYQKMKEELRDGRWDFGEKIIVNDLIERFNVSRRPVMDAMKMLENEGFIEIIPQSGCKVVDYSKQNILDQLILSSALEALCAELAAKNHTENELELLENYQNNVKKNMTKIKDKQSYFKYNREFHYHISSMTHSTKIQTQAMQMWDLNDFFLINLFEQFDVNESISYHDQVIQAISQRDALNAKKIMEEHIRNYAERLIKQLP